MLQLTRLLVAAALLAAVSTAVQASSVIPHNFDAYGSHVSGYQDFFTGSTLNPAWTYVGGNGSSPFSLDTTNHVLDMNPANGDPNKLLYNPSTPYDSQNQTVLAMIQVTGGLTDGGDGFRGGVAAQSSSGSGQGINLLFRQPGENGNGQHFNLLNDSVAWGPNTGSWSPNTYYWLKETTDSNGNITAAIWAADGVTPESSAATATWSQGGRSGLAGLVTDSNGGQATFTVNYALIEANGLPTITAGQSSAVPEPASLALAGIGAAVLGCVRLRRRAIA